MVNAPKTPLNLSEKILFHVTVAIKLMSTIYALLYKLLVVECIDLYTLSSHDKLTSNIHELTCQIIVLPFITYSSSLSVVFLFFSDDVFVAEKSLLLCRSDTPQT